MVRSSSTFRVFGMTLAVFLPVAIAGPAVRGAPVVYAVEQAAHGRLMLTLDWSDVARGRADARTARPHEVSLYRIVDGRPERHARLRVTVPPVNSVQKRTPPRPGFVSLPLKLPDSLQDGLYRVTVGIAAEQSDPPHNREAIGVLDVKNDRDYLFFTPYESENHAYPPEISEWTEADKQRQREAGRKLLEDLWAALDAGDREFSIPRGDYRLPFDLKHPRQQYAGSGAHILLSDVDDLTIHGNGATLWIEEWRPYGMCLYKSSNVTVRDLVIDYDPLPFVQGTVVATNGEERTVTFRLDPGFERSIAPFTDPDSRIRKVVYKLFEGEVNRGRLFKMHQPGGHIGRERRIRHLGNDLYKAGFDCFGETPKARGIRVGDAVGFRTRFNGVINLEQCSGIRLDGVTIYAAGRGAVRSHFSLGKNVFTNVRIQRRSNTRRLMSTASDPMHLVSPVVGPTIRNCTIDGGTDDCIAIPIFDSMVVERPAPTELIVSSRQGSALNFASGSEVLFYGYADFRNHGHARAVEVERYKPGRNAVNRLQERIRARPAIPEHRFRLGRLYSVQFHTLPEDVDVTDIIMCPSNAAARHTEIRKNFIYNNSTRAVLMTGYDALVTGNTIVRTGPIRMVPSTYWLNGIFSRHIRIENNVLRNVLDNSVPISLTAGAFGMSETPIRDITVRGNTIINSSYAGLFLANCEQVRIKNNLFINCNRLDDGEKGRRVLGKAGKDIPLDHAVVVKSCRDVAVERNRVRDPGAFYRGPVRRLTPARSELQDR